MKKYYKYKIRFLLNLFIVFITINKSVFTADRKSPFVINNVIEEDSKCINKCDEKSYTATRKACWSYWNSSPQPGCVIFDKRPGSQFSLIYNVDLHKSGNNYDWGYVAYDGVCIYAGGLKENLWASGEQSKIGKYVFNSRYGVDLHTNKVNFSQVDSWANDYIKGVCNEFFQKSSTKSLIGACKEKCRSNVIKLFIGKKAITTIWEFLDEIPVTELIKVYDPNMVNY